MTRLGKGKGPGSGAKVHPAVLVFPGWDIAIESAAWQVAELAARSNLLRRLQSAVKPCIVKRRARYWVASISNTGIR